MNIEEAKNFINYLHRKNLLYKFENGCSARAVVHLQYSCSLKEAISIGFKIKKIYGANLDWGKDVSPQGYAKYLISVKGGVIHQHQ